MPPALSSARSGRFSSPPPDAACSICSCARTRWESRPRAPFWSPASASMPPWLWAPGSFRPRTIRRRRPHARMHWGSFGSSMPPSPAIGRLRKHSTGSPPPVVRTPASHAPRLSIPRSPMNSMTSSAESSPDLIRDRDQWQRCWVTWMSGMPSCCATSTVHRCSTTTASSTSHPAASTRQRVCPHHDRHRSVRPLRTPPATTRSRQLWFASASPVRELADWLWESSERRRDSMRIGCRCVRHPASPSVRTSSTMPPRTGRNGSRSRPIRSTPRTPITSMTRI